MVDNLVDNAVKYSPAGSLVRVAIASAEDGIELSVSDQGPGIPIEMRRKVFERFFRLPELTQSGSGLGLAIVDKAMQRMGGQVEFTNAPEGGLVVHLRLRHARMARA